MECNGLEDILTVLNDLMYKTIIHSAQLPTVYTNDINTHLNTIITISVFVTPCLLHQIFCSAN
jgi:hypothetical protein